MALDKRYRDIPLRGEVTMLIESQHQCEKNISWYCSFSDKEAPALVQLVFSSRYCASNTCSSSDNDHLKHFLLVRVGLCPKFFGSMCWWKFKFDTCVLIGDSVPRPYDCFAACEEIKMNCVIICVIANLFDLIKKFCQLYGIRVQSLCCSIDLFDGTDRALMANPDFDVLWYDSQKFSFHFRPDSCSYMIDC